MLIIDVCFNVLSFCCFFFFFFQAEDGIRDYKVTGVQTCALPISAPRGAERARRPGEARYDFEAAFLLEALVQGLRVRSVPIATVYEGRPSHFRYWGDTWRLARVFTRYGRAIIFGVR